VWRIDQLLVSRFLINQQLEYNNGRHVFPMWSVPRCYKQETSVDSSVRESVKRGFEPEA
jgi:hypothetical protein